MSQKEEGNIAIQTEGEAVCPKHPHAAHALACPEDPAAPVRPATRDQLRRFVAAELGLNIPDRSLCPGHNSPMDYLWHSFNADFAAPPAANGDCVVWANRGGGKTQLAAVATLLEGLFKPGCQTRLLAGSRDQAHRMYDYLPAFLQDDFSYALDGRLLTDACRFTNGARSKSCRNRPPPSAADTSTSSAATRWSCSTPTSSPRRNSSPAAATASAPRWRCSAPSTAPGA